MLRLLAWRLATIAIATTAGMACGDTSDDAQDSLDDSCADVGETQPCGCDNGASVTRVCMPDGVFSRCDCHVARTLPCVAPGVEFPCACAGGGQGAEICLDDGSYTECDCGPELAAGGDDGGTPPVVDEPQDMPPSTGCPAGLSCQLQMGVRVCADGAGLPPICEALTDCTAAGFTDAQCVDPVASGVTFCVQICP